MSLVERVADLARRLAQELSIRPTQDHPGLARAWVCFRVIDERVQIGATHNVAGVSRLSKGQYRIRFAAALPDANYAWSALARSPQDQGTQRWAQARAWAEAKTESFVDVVCASASGRLADSPEVNLVVYR